MAVPVHNTGSVISGKYRVLGTLGVGGMAVVLEVRHLFLGQRLAVKMLHADTLASPERRARFKREARIAAQLTSEHVTRVLDMGEADDGQPYLVMELLEGHDLAEELRLRGRLPISDAVDYVLQACEALAEAHAAGLVHRDIKPANLFIAQRPLSKLPLLKVLDFGLSKADHDGNTSLTRTGKAFGTPHYMSPEQLASTKHVDARTDQHALGAVLFELLTGRPPYDGASPAAIAVGIVQRPPPALTSVLPKAPRTLEKVLLRTLAKSPDGRFPDVGELARALAPFGGPGAAALVESTSRALRRHRKIAGGSGTDEQALGTDSPRRKVARLPLIDLDDSSDPPSRARSHGLPVLVHSDDDPSDSDAVTRARPVSRLPKIYDDPVSEDATTVHLDQPPARRGKPVAKAVAFRAVARSKQRGKAVKFAHRLPPFHRAPKRKFPPGLLLALLVLLGLLFGIGATWLFFAYGRL